MKKADEKKALKEAFATACDDDHLFNFLLLAIVGPFEEALSRLHGPGGSGSGSEKRSSSETLDTIGLLCCLLVHEQAAPLLEKLYEEHPEEERTAALDMTNGGTANHRHVICEKLLSVAEAIKADIDVSDRINPERLGQEAFDLISSINPSRGKFKDANEFMSLRTSMINQFETLHTHVNRSGQAKEAGTVEYFHEVTDL
jgi:hypothetical protein